MRASLGLEALRRLALDEALAIVRTEGDRTAVAVWSEIFDLSGGLDASLHAEAADKLAELVPEGYNAARVRALSGARTALL